MVDQLTALFPFGIEGCASRLALEVESAILVVGRHWSDDPVAWRHHPHRVAPKAVLPQWQSNRIRSEFRAADLSINEGAGRNAGRPEGTG
jgi:hypothetical protein